MLPKYIYSVLFKPGVHIIILFVFMLCLLCSALEKSKTRGCTNGISRSARFRSVLKLWLPNFKAQYQQTSMEFTADSTKSWAKLPKRWQALGGSIFVTSSVLESLCVRANKLAPRWDTLS